MSIKVMIVDDHTIVRQGLRSLLSMEPDIEIVAEASNGDMAVKLAHQLKPDVILMDLLMPVMDGITATGIIRRELPEVEVLALTSVLEDGSVVQAVKAGAIGYLLKDKGADEIYQAIKAAATGQVQLSTQAVARLIREMQEPEEPTIELTNRELEVLKLLVQGQANKDIARELSLGEKTVKKYVSSILSKLGVQSRTQAALLAVQLDLVHSENHDQAHEA